MSTPAPETPVSAAPKPSPFERYIKPLLTPYYLVVAGVIGGITVAFGAVTLILILVATNFNLLGWME